MLHVNDWYGCVSGKLGSPTVRLFSTKNTKSGEWWSDPYITIIPMLGIIQTEGFEQTSIYTWPQPPYCSPS